MLRSFLYLHSWAINEHCLIDVIDDTRSKAGPHNISHDYVQVHGMQPHGSLFEKDNTSGTISTVYSDSTPTRSSM